MLKQIFKLTLLFTYDIHNINTNKRHSYTNRTQMKRKWNI